MGSRPAFLPYLNTMVERKTAFVQITPDDGFLICQKRLSSIEIYNDCDGRMLEVFHLMRTDPYAFYCFAERPSIIRKDRALVRVVQRYLYSRKYLIPLSGEHVPKIMSAQKDLAMFLSEFAPEPIGEFMLRWSFVEVDDMTFDNIIYTYDTRQTLFFAWLHKLSWDEEEIMERMHSVEGWFVVAHNVAWSSSTKTWRLARLTKPEWCEDGWMLFHNTPFRWS